MNSTDRVTARKASPKDKRIQQFLTLSPQAHTLLHTQAKEWGIPLSRAAERMFEEWAKGYRQCPNGCGPLKAGELLGWDCERCAYYEAH